MSSTIKVNNIQNLAGDDSGFDLSTNDQVDIKTANTTRVRVDSSGNIGVGISSPTFSSGNGIHLADSFFIGFGNGANVFFKNTSHDCFKQVVPRGEIIL